MAQLVKLATLDQVPQGSGVAFDIAGRRIAVFAAEGSYYAIDDTCPHAGASLAAGGVEGCRVACPWHGATFDLRTGAVMSPPSRGPVQTYRVVVEGTELKVELPEPAT